jgi:hypothetical protein
LIFDTLGNLYFLDCPNRRIRRIDTNGIINTIAGNGMNVFSGDGGPAIMAGMSYPSNIGLDKLGNVYVTEDGRVRKIDSTGIINTIAGDGSYGYSGDGGPALSAQFNYPGGIIIDSTGNIYVADFDHSVIRKISAPATTLPVITSFNPLKAPAGALVTIKGAAFAGISSVKLGGADAASFTVIDDSTITASVGNGATGNVSVSTLNSTAILEGFVFVTSCYWNGTVSDAWEIAVNWSCGFIPNNNTSIFINSGTVVLSSNSSVWSLTVGPTASFTVTAPYQLTLLH